MREELVTFKTAQLAKEKGFKFDRKSDKWYEIYEPNRMSYYPRRDTGKFYALGDYYHDTNQNIQQYNVTESIDAPTQSLLQKWLREKHKLHIEVRVVYEKDYFSYSIFKLNPYEQLERQELELDEILTYEEALEKGLFEVLKLVSDKVKV